MVKAYQSPQRSATTRGQQTQWYIYTHKCSFVTLKDINYRWNYINTLALVHLITQVHLVWGKMCNQSQHTICIHRPCHFELCPRDSAIYTEATNLAVMQYLSNTAHSHLCSKKYIKKAKLWKKVTTHCNNRNRLLLDGCRVTDTGLTCQRI